MGCGVSISFAFHKYFLSNERTYTMGHNETSFFNPGAPKNCFLDVSFLYVFCRIARPTDPEMKPNVSLLDFPADVMSQLGVISSTLVFERPYCGFATFSHVS